MKGYSNDLYILAFDHRGTLTKGLLGVEGREPTDEEKKLPKFRKQKGRAKDGKGKQTSNTKTED